MYEGHLLTYSLATTYIRDLLRKLLCQATRSRPLDPMSFDDKRQ